MEDFRIEDIALRLIDVDGLDATEKLLDMAKNFEKLDAIILGGITFAGFNLIDPIVVHAELKVPIICLLYTSPSPRDLSTSRMPSSA